MTTTDAFSIRTRRNWPNLVCCALKSLVGRLAEFAHQRRQPIAAGSSVVSLRARVVVSVT